MDLRRLSLALAISSVVLAAPCAAKDTGLIFVSNEKSNNIIVLEPKTYKVVKDIKTSRRPRDMHFDAAHQKLYVACGDDDVIEIIDVAKLAVIGKLATGTSPETFAIDESRRRIYVANEESSSLSIIDMDQNIIVHEVPTGAEPEGVSIGKDGKVVYVTSEVGDLVHEIDPGGRASISGTRSYGEDMPFRHWASGLSFRKNSRLFGSVGSVPSSGRPSCDSTSATSGPMPM